MDCIKTCCKDEQKRRHALEIAQDCRFTPGIYRNVNIEIGDDCKIKWLEPAAHDVVLMCDPCGADDD